MRLRKRQTRASAGITALVTLQEMKDHLLEYNDDRDSVITALIASCTADLQKQLGFYIDTTGAIYQHYDAFKNEMLIFHAFIKSDTADVVVQYLDSSYAWQTVSSEYYRIAPASTPPRIILKANYAWPETLGESECVRISFKADTTHTAWASFKQCIKEMVAEAYENPEGSWHSAVMESAVTRVVAAYRLRA